MIWHYNIYWYDNDIESGARYFTMIPDAEHYGQGFRCESPLKDEGWEFEPCNTCIACQIQFALTAMGMGSEDMEYSWCLPIPISENLENELHKLMEKYYVPRDPEHYF